MSPVAPTGPPHTRATSINGAGPVSTMNGTSNGGRDAAKVASKTYAHLDDLTSVTPDLDINAPIRRIIQDAEALAKSATTSLDFKRPDVALQDFIKASTIAMDIVPRHKDFPSVSSGQGELNRTWMGVLKRIKAQQSRFEGAKQLIKEDNERSGVRPKKFLNGIENDHTASLGGTKTSSNGVRSADSLPGTTLSGMLNGSANGMSSRKKPPIQPKPDALHGKALPPSVANSPSNVSDLASRFARLRSPAPISPVQDPRIRTQLIEVPETPGNITSSPTNNQSAAYPTTLRPLGPREMPSVPISTPRSNRLPLDTDIPGMPKAPDAIYSPSRNPDTAATIYFPTSIPRSSSYIGSGNNAAPPVSSAVRTPSLDGRQEYFNPTRKENGSGSARPDPTIPNSKTVTPSELTEYLRMGSQSLRILLIDVRSREEFDDGHIMCSSTMCIEPLILRHEMSAEDIVETLVLSPESELKLYEQRHEFDLVVFYDQCSSTPKHLIGDKMEILAKAMYDYGYEKRLKRHPMLLVGGVDAWTDLLGPSSLQSSSTGPAAAKQTNGARLKPVRPLGRRDANRFAPGRKRTYESRTLSKEEENKWDETLREHPANENGPSPTHESADELSYVRTTEDFFRRYPELPSIQESMISSLPAPKRVAYNHAPVNSIPDPPARPAPALPRTRSSGVLERGPTTTYAMSSGIGTSSVALQRTSGLTGLSNPGVTCYANSMVQCLGATGPIRNYLISFVSGGQQFKVPRKENETTDPPQLFGRVLGNLFGHMWSGQYDYVAPSTFLNYVNAIHIATLPRTPKGMAFGGMSLQHDASEFLGYILSILHDETNRNRDQLDYQAQQHAELLRNYPHLKTLSGSEQYNFDHDERTSYLPTAKALRQEWDRQLKAENSIVSRTFHGQQTNMVRCTKPTCGFRKHRFSSLTRVQLQFPSRHVQNAGTATVPLMDMFGSAFNVKDSNDAIMPGLKCHKCKDEQCLLDAAVTYMPDYLIVDIQRFAQREDGTIGDKITALVRFNETIDLSSILLDTGNARPGELHSPGQIGPFKYQCYAVVFHTGNTIGSGHYTSMARNLDNPGHPSHNWHEFNDAKVTPTKFSECQKPSRKTVSTLFLKRVF